MPRDPELIPDPRGARAWSPLSVVGWTLAIPSLCLLVVAYVWFLWV